jgi:hypothetical protein
MLQNEKYILSFLLHSPTLHSLYYYNYYQTHPLEELFLQTPPLVLASLSSRQTHPQYQYQQQEKEQGHSWNFSLVQQLIRVLMDAMGFEIHDKKNHSQHNNHNFNSIHQNNEKGDEKDEEQQEEQEQEEYIVQFAHNKIPSERPSSIKSLVDLHMAITKSTTTTSSSTTTKSDKNSGLFFE